MDLDTNSLLVGVVYGFLIYLIGVMNHNFSILRRKQLRDERKIDAIIKHLEVDWQSNADPRILELIQANAKSDAIQAYQDSKGVSRKTAVAYVDSYSNEYECVC